MYIKAESLKEINNHIKQNLDIEYFEKYKIPIYYNIKQFKKDVKNLVKIMENSSHGAIYKRIIKIKLQNLTEEDFDKLLSYDFQLNEPHYQEANPRINSKIKYIMNITKNLKFILSLIKELDKQNPIHQYIFNLMLNAQYGIIKRLYQFIQHIHRMWFSITILEIMMRGLHEEPIDQNLKAQIAFNYLKYYINFNHVFHYSFLQGNNLVYFYNFISQENILNAKFYFKKRCRLLNKCLNEILFGLIQDQLQGGFNSNLDYFELMFNDERYFEEILKLMKYNLYILIKIAYPEDEIEIVNRFLSNLEHKKLTGNKYLIKEDFIKDFFNGYFKFIALSSLTKPFYLQDIFGNLNYNPIVKNLMQKYSSSTIEDPEYLFTFLKDDSSADVFHILKYITQNKISFLVKKMIEYRLENTYMKIFNIYKNYLKESPESILEKLTSEDANFDV